MDLFPQFRLGWLNAWLPMLLFYGIFAILLWIFPHKVVQRLYDRTGWTPEQNKRRKIARFFGIALIVLVIFMPLKLTPFNLIAGGIVHLAGYVWFIWSLLTYCHTPFNEPVTRGLYRISRNPQWVGLVLAFLGVFIAAGSWLMLLLLLILVVNGHYRILAEEEACLAQYGDSYRDFMESVPRYFLFF